MRKTILSVLAVAALAGVANAQLVVGRDGTNPEIWHIDLNTQQATRLLSGSQATTWGMAYDVQSNTLYWNNGGTLFSSPFSLNGLNPTQLGTFTFNGQSTNFVSLAFRNGMLYGTRNITTEAVYEINPNTLQAQIVYQYNSAFDFGGLDFDENGRLFGLSDANGAGLYELDIQNQTTSFIVGSPNNDTDIDGLAVGGGKAFFVNDRSDQPIYVYNLGTGQFEAPIPTPFPGSGIFSGGTYVIPAPGAAALVGLGGLVTLRRRR